MAQKAAAPVTQAPAAAPAVAAPAPAQDSVDSELSDVSNEAEVEAEASGGASSASGGTVSLPAGGVSGSSGSTEAGYIAAADTNDDKTVSDAERIAYEQKLARAAATNAQAQPAPASDRSEEIEASYLPEQQVGTQLDLNA